MARRRRRMEGVAELRKAMRALPDAAKAEIGDVLESGGFDVVSAMRAKARRRTGRMERAIKYRLYSKGLILRAGFIDKDAPFYGRIQDLGRKQQVVRVRRRIGARVRSYTMRVRHMEGTRFITGSYKTLQSRILRNLATVGDKIARRLGMGK